MAQQRNSSRLLIRSLFAILATTSFIFGGCTDDQSTVGSKFIPENERYQIAVDTSELVDAYTVLQDSILTGNFSKGIIGSMTNPFLGRTTATIATGIYPYFKDVALFDPNNQRELDSVVVILDITGVIGQKNKPITVYLHELTKNLVPDTIKHYYSNSVISDFDNGVMASFTMNKVERKRIKLDGALATKFGNNLINLTKEEMESDSLFELKIKGFYFNTNPDESDGAFYTINPIGSQISVYYKISSTKDGVVTKDTTNLPFFFTSYRGNAQRFISIKRDITKANSLLVPKYIGDTLTRDTVFYSSTMGGSIAYINLKKFLSWRDSLPVIFHRVELVVEYQKTPETEIDRIPSRFGLFTRSSVGLYSPIFDLKLESASTNFSGTFDANFRKGKMLYSANITRHFQSMMTTDSLSRIYLIPLSRDQKPASTNTSFFEDYSYGVFRGTTNSSPIKLIITYSKLKK